MKGWKAFEKGFPASKLVINDRIDIAILLNIACTARVPKHRCKVSERKVFLFACRLFRTFFRRGDRGF